MSGWILVCSCSRRLSIFASRLGGKLNVPSDWSFYDGFLMTVLACHRDAVNICFSPRWGLNFPSDWSFYDGFFDNCFGLSPGCCAKFAYRSSVGLNLPSD